MWIEAVVTKFKIGQYDGIYLIGVRETKKASSAPQPEI
jgi:hypothetical protein